MRFFTVLGFALLLVACAGNEPSPPLPTAEASEIVQRQLDLGIGYMRNGEGVNLLVTTEDGEPIGLDLAGG